MVVSYFLVSRSISENHLKCFSTLPNEQKTPILPIFNFSLPVNTCSDILSRYIVRYVRMALTEGKSDCFVI